MRMRFRTARVALNLYIRTGCAFLGVEGCVMAILAPDGWENRDGFPSRLIAVGALVAGLTP